MNEAVNAEPLFDLHLQNHTKDKSYTFKAMTQAEVNVMITDSNILAVKNGQHITATVTPVAIH